MPHPSRGLVLGQGGSHGSGSATTGSVDEWSRLFQARPAPQQNWEGDQVSL